MEATKKSREELGAEFCNDACPTADSYKMIFNSTFNLLDDAVDCPDGANPLTIKSKGITTALKIEGGLQIEGDLHVRSDQNRISISQFLIGGKPEENKVLLVPEGGKVGIGVDKPDSLRETTLTVNGGMSIEKISFSDGTTQISAYARGGLIITPFIPIGSPISFSSQGSSYAVAKQFKVSCEINTVTQSIEISTKTDSIIGWYYGLTIIYPPNGAKKLNYIFIDGIANAGSNKLNVYIKNPLNSTYSLHEIGINNPEVIDLKLNDSSPIMIALSYDQMEGKQITINRLNFLFL